MGEYHILMQFDLVADREAVHRALSNPTEIATWWSSRTGGDPDGRVGGRLEVLFPDQPQPFEFEIVRNDAERVEWRTGGFPPWWAGTSIRWDLADNPEASAGTPGTRLLFGHRDYDPDNPVIPIVTPAWALIIGRFKERVETGARHPFFDF